MKTLRIDRSREWTVDDFLKLEESNTLCKLINGALVIPPTPSPIHQNTNDNLYSFFKAEARKIGDIVYWIADPGQSYTRSI